MDEKTAFVTCVAIEYCTHNQAGLIIAHARAEFSGDWVQSTKSVQSFVETLTC